jgi:hypothetical protein
MCGGHSKYDKQHAMPQNAPSQAPELRVSEWLNTQTPLSLAGLRGRVVVMEAFQMLCPGCVQGGLPQVARVQEHFPESEVAVLGLHAVFEHHEAQGSRAALAAFLHEFHYSFPTGIDCQPPEGAGRALPLTMAAYAMQGTPTLVLIDRQGRLRRQIFGHVADMRLGAEIMALIQER